MNTYFIYIFHFEAQKPQIVILDTIARNLVILTLIGYGFWIDIIKTLNQINKKRVKINKIIINSFLSFIFLHTKNTNGINKSIVKNKGAIHSLMDIVLKTLS